MLVKYWPAPPTIHRGLEWPQFLNSLFSVCLFSVCLFSVGKFSNFFVQYKAAGVRKNVVRMNTDVQYSTVQYIDGRIINFGSTLLLVSCPRFDNIYFKRS